MGDYRYIDALFKHEELIEKTMHNPKMKDELLKANVYLNTILDDLIEAYSNVFEGDREAILPSPDK